MTPTRIGLIALLACCSSPARSRPPATPAVDQCPDEPEDLDNFADDDGCPDPDNDHDRIPDSDDLCPNDAEVYNGYEDTDGCPDRGCVLVKQFPSCIDDRVYFERGKSAVDAVAYGAILDMAAKAMSLGAADIQLVTVRGYRSADEPAPLARERAVAIRGELVRRGVQDARLEIADGGIASPPDAPNGQRRVAIEIAKQRWTIDDADDIVCTPMGRWFVKLTEAEKRARCR